MKPKTKTKGENKMGAKLEVSILVGAESKEWLSALTEVVERLEALSETTTTPVTKTKAAATTTTTVTTKKTTKPVVTEDEEETFDLDAADETEDDETPTVTKKELIAACKENRTAAIKAMKKLKVSNIHELKPSQYARVMAELGA